MRSYPVQLRGLVTIHSSYRYNISDCLEYICMFDFVPGFVFVMVVSPFSYELLYIPAVKPGFNHGYIFSGLEEVECGQSFSSVACGFSCDAAIHAVYDVVVMVCEYNAIGCFAS